MTEIPLLPIHVSDELAVDAGDCQAKNEGKDGIAKQIIPGETCDVLDHEIGNPNSSPSQALVYPELLISGFDHFNKDRQGQPLICPC